MYSPKGDGLFMKELQPYQQQFFDALRTQNINESLDIIETAVGAGFPPKLILLHIVIPAIERVGVMQANNEITLSEVFVVARITDMAVERLSRLMNFKLIHALDERPSPGTVILGSAEGDYHSLGRKIVATFLKVAGFKVIDLGMTVPAYKFVDAAIENNSRIICVSALLLHTAERIKDIRDLLHERGLQDQIKIIAGGAVFTIDHELYKTVGADATANNAYSAVTVVQIPAGRRTVKTSYERVNAVLSHQTPDCVPACPILLLQGAAELGLSLEDYFSRADQIAEGQLRLWEKFGHDFVFGFPHIVEDITAFGGSLKYYRNGPPSPGGMVIQSYDDILNMTAPDPLSSPVLNETLRAIELLAGQVKGSVPVLGACIAPFSLPSMLMGTEQWMELLFIESQEVRDEVLPCLLATTTEFCAVWANAQLNAGADAIILADGMASAAVLTRPQFIELALPVVKDTISRIKGPVVHEGVGDLQPFLDLLVDTGVIAAILTSKDDLAKAKASVGAHMALIGNLNNVEICRWTSEERDSHLQETLALGAPGGGFILSTQGPELPLCIPEGAIHALVQAAHNWTY